MENTVMAARRAVALLALLHVARGWSGSGSELARRIGASHRPMGACLSASLPRRERSEEGCLVPFSASNARAHVCKLGILLLSQGAPDSAVDLEEYLYNIFEDPEVVTIPKSVRWAKRPLAWAIAKTSAQGLKRSTDGLIDAVSISESQQLRTVREQGAALEEALARRGVTARTFVAMRYWKPFIGEAVQELKEDGVSHLVILPLYPQFSLSTSGSSLRVLEDTLDSDPDFSAITNTVIPSWYKQPAYVEAIAHGVQKACEGLRTGTGAPDTGTGGADTGTRTPQAVRGKQDGTLATPDAAEGPAAATVTAPEGKPRKSWLRFLRRLDGAAEGGRTSSRRTRTLDAQAVSSRPPPTIVFSAVSLPEKYVTDLGDPYVEQIELTAGLVMAKVAALFGQEYPHVVAYQGQAAQKPSVPNRIRWVGPDMEEVLPELRRQGTRDVVVVPISFLYEQRGTLYMQDIVYRQLARDIGIEGYARVPTLGADPLLVDALAEAVEGSLPSLVEDANPLEKAVDRGIPMHLTVVNDLLELQQKGDRKLTLVPQEQPWGLSKSEAKEAELINGRVAMAALLVLISQGVIVDNFFPGIWKEVLETTVSSARALSEMASPALG